jgi:hypothetical protein
VAAGVDSFLLLALLGMALLVDILSLYTLDEILNFKLFLLLIFAII